MNTLNTVTILLFFNLSFAVAAEQTRKNSADLHNHIQTLLLAEPGAEQECASSKGQLNGCTARLYAEAERARKNAEAATLAAMKRLDTAMKTNKASTAFAQDVKAYEQYKTAHCNWITASQAGSGLDCEVDLDRARAHALSIYYTR
jgi:hypothetical protein